jgi:hypothetical protein
VLANQLAAVQEGAENEEASAVNQEEQKQEEPEGQQPSQPLLPGKQPVSESFAMAAEFKPPVTEAMEVEPVEIKGFEDIQDKLVYPKRNRSKPRQPY